MENLSKYDVMSKKMNKFSELLCSFVAKYVISLTKKKKCETIKNFLDKILCDAHIIFEMKKDFSNYLYVIYDLDPEATELSNDLNETSKELEKILLLYRLFNKYGEDFICELFIDIISKKISIDEVIFRLNHKASDEEKAILKLIGSNEYDFNILPKKYQELMLNEHQEYMDENINLYVNKVETSSEEILKGINIYEENVDIDLNIEFKSHHSNKQKRKD